MTDPIENAHSLTRVLVNAERASSKQKLELLGDAYKAELQQARERIAALEGLLREVTCTAIVYGTAADGRDTFMAEVHESWEQRRDALLNGGPDEPV